MLFNSIEFSFFLPVVFILYWFVTRRNLKNQNFLLVAASYLFYGWWDWRFLSLIIFSSCVDFFVGVALGRAKLKAKRKALLGLSLIVNLSFLGFFKYFNFFSESFAETFTLLGVAFEPSRLNIILPVGISFYTFQTLSYSIDVYRKQLEPTKDIISFFAFVSFFPQLVAGPIERATNLLPQFYKKRKFDFDKAVDGLQQILWGLFKKVVIADNCAEYANLIFNSSDQYNGSTLAIGALLFTFQIYGDFSGYSDIAIGTSRLFGFDLKKNFAFPYFSRDIAEFWRRWHISLSTWFRDYLYIPLGGSQGGKLSKIRNTFIIFIVSGFWHGANWTFIIWGVLNALYFLPLLLLGQNRSNLGVVAENSFFPSVLEIFKILLTFILTVIAWVFFRADSVSHAIQYLSCLFDYSLFESLEVNIPRRLYALIGLSIGIEWIMRREEYGFKINSLIDNRFLRWLCYLCVCYLIFWFAGKPQEFVYFQF